MKRRLVLITLVVAMVVLTGCVTLHQPILQLESGPYPAPDQAATGAAIGAAIGAAPGVVTGSGELAWGGALLGGAIGGLLGNVQDQKSLERATKEARIYREKIRREWMQTYKILAESRFSASEKVVPPRVIVVDAEKRPRGWRYGAILAIEQGLRQRRFQVVAVPSLTSLSDFYRHSSQRVPNYFTYDVDFLVEALIQDLDSAVKIILTLRSLKGMSELDRQGTGISRYQWHPSRERGPSRKEQRVIAAQRAAKQAVENLFIYRYENALGS